MNYTQRELIKQSIEVALQAAAGTRCIHCLNGNPYRNLPPPYKNSMGHWLNADGSSHAKCDARGIHTINRVDLIDTVLATLTASHR